MGRGRPAAAGPLMFLLAGFAHSQIPPGIYTATIYRDELGIGPLPYWVKLDRITS